MRRVRYSVAASLDGFIAGPGGEYDWIPEESGIDFRRFLDRIDTVLMGRKSFQTAQEAGGLGFLGDASVYVFSRTLEAGPKADHTVVSEDPADFVRTLKGEEGKDIWLFGGGSLFGVLLAAELVDLVEVAIAPALLGRGVPLLEAAEPVHLDLERTEPFPSGIILNRYRVRIANGAEASAPGSEPQRSLDA